MKADIIAFEGRTLVSKLIKLITKKKVTHIAIMVGDYVLMETSFFGVRLRKLKENEAKYYILRNNNITSEERRKITSFVLHKVKIKYDFKLLIGIGINIIFGINTKWDNKEKYICIELILDAYKSIGIDLLPELCNNHIIPNDILYSKELNIVDSL